MNECTIFPMPENCMARRPCNCETFLLYFVLFHHRNDIKKLLPVTVIFPRHIEVHHIYQQQQRKQQKQVNLKSIWFNQAPPHSYHLPWCMKGTELTDWK